VLVAALIALVTIVVVVRLAGRVYRNSSLSAPGEPARGPVQPS
jgi:hypothetical protein